MASTGKCPYCGSTVRSDQVACPNCGAANEQYVVDTPRTIYQPKTIEELREYCAERGMPLLRMRFFIGENYKSPRAFGIYRDGKDVIVYKNKADGNRSVRYRGTDEARGVRELYQKLLEECHNRGIYPDGKPMAEKKKSTAEKKAAKEPASPRNPLVSFCEDAVYTILLLVGYGLRKLLIPAAVFLLIVAATQCAHISDGYYQVEGDDRVYYNYGTDWYYSYEDDDGGNYWYEADSPPAGNYSEYSLGEDWNSDWGVGDFKESSVWQLIQSDSSYSDDSDDGSDYGWDDDDDWDWDWDSWDSDDTDWDSDW